jgi:hypothetical protein
MDINPDPTAIQIPWLISPKKAGASRLCCSPNIGHLTAYDTNLGAIPWSNCLDSQRRV